MITGSTFTGLQGGNVDLGYSALNGASLGASSYYNVPTTLTNINFDTSAGNITLELDLPANTYSITSGSTITGANTILVLAVGAGTRTISTNIASNRFALASGSTGTYTVATITAPLVFTGLPTGARVTVFNAGTVTDTAVSTGSTLNMTVRYDLATALTYRVHASGYQSVSGSITVAEGTNTIPVSLPQSFGYGVGDCSIRQLNGTTINAGGDIDVNTTNKTITFVSACSLRETFSVLQDLWVRADVGGTLNTRPPVQLDSVKGLELLDGWTITNHELSTGEGYITKNTSDVTTNLFYRLRVNNNTHDVIVSLIYNDVQQASNTYTGQQERLISVDLTVAKVQIRTQIKSQQIVFIDRTELVRLNAQTSYQRNYQNENTEYSETADSSVNADLAQNDALYRHIHTPINRTDVNGLQHSFTHIVQVDPQTLTRQYLLNQFAAVATFDTEFASKFYALQPDGTITLTQGLWVQNRDGTNLAGSMLALLNLSSAAGTYVKPQSRVISISKTAQTQALSYIVIDAGTENIITDASGIAVQGTLALNQTTADIWTILQNTDRNLTIRWIGAGITYGEVDQTLASTGITYVIQPSGEEVLMPATNQSTDNTTTGVVAWRDTITLTTFNTTTKDIIVPTETLNGEVVRSYNAIYFFLAWRNWVLADTTRLRFGQAVYGEHQLRPAGAVDNSYMLRPGVYFNDTWALNVPANRGTNDIVRLEASNLGRLDPTSNSGLIYRSPMLNGASSMAEVVIQGASTTAITNTYNTALNNSRSLENVKNALGWLASNGKLLGLKPMPDAFDKTNDYKGNVE